MNLTWHRGRLTEVARDVLSTNFNKKINQLVYWAVLPANHRNHRVVVIPELEKLGTPRVVTAQLAAHLIEPTSYAPHSVRPRLNEMCEQLGFFKRFCLGEDDDQQ